MPLPSSKRLLTIGEFSAATQLSPKALRLYGDQQLLPPARIDTTTGYRYYHSDQVARGRLIRALREMSLSLADIAVVIAVQGADAQRVLGEFAIEQDYRYAREKRAFQAALLLLMEAAAPEAPEISELERPATTVAVREFIAERSTFSERFRAELCATEELLLQAQLQVTGAASCSLLDPLCDEEGRLEIVIPVVLPAQLPPGVSFRQLQARRCAAISIDGSRVHASDIAAALDTLFDWFDRRGYCAIEPPQIAINDGDAEPKSEITWAFDPAPPS